MAIKIVVEARVREIMEKSNLGVTRLADGALDSLNVQVENIIRAACVRAHANNRVGLKPEDF